MLADIELVTLHHGPIAVARLLHLIGEPRNALDGVKGKLVAVEIVEHHHVEGRGRRPFLLVAAYMDVVVIVPPVGQPMDNPWISMKREYHGLVAGEDFVEIPVFETVRMLSLRLQRHHRSTTLTTRMRMSGTYSRSNVTAASASSVGTLPAQAMTTSGSPASLLAHCQMPIPAAQWRAADSMSSHCHSICLPAMIRLT